MHSRDPPPPAKARARPKRRRSEPPPPAPPETRAPAPSFTRTLPSPVGPGTKTVPGSGGCATAHHTSGAFGSGTVVQALGSAPLQNWKAHAPAELALAQAGGYVKATLPSQPRSRGSAAPLDAQEAAPLGHRKAVGGALALGEAKAPAKSAVEDAPTGELCQYVAGERPDPATTDAAAISKMRRAGKTGSCISNFFIELFEGAGFGQERGVDEFETLNRREGGFFFSQ
jgi:hypothetical protein